MTIAADLPLKALVTRAADRFASRFGRRPTQLAVAPGRVNLIGEHTDYNGGFVLPMAIERYTVIAASPSATDANGAPSLIRVFSEAANAADQFEPCAELERGPREWTNYFRGVVAGFVARNGPCGGFDAVVESTVPLGGGLSSSAALEVATATLLEELTSTKLPLAEKALLCQWAEHEYARVPCGIMDQFASVFGRADHLLLLDCRSQQTRLVPFADSEIAVMIINSNVRHALTGGEYAERRATCEQAAERLGVAELRDIEPQQLRAAAALLSPLHLRRARHVVTENDRTIAAAEAIERGDWRAAGVLMAASHASLRDDFEVSCLELDLLVDLALEMGVERGVYGARMTGGGFGGCAVSLVRRNALADVAEHIARGYRRRVGIEPTIFATRPAEGARLVRLD